jgi:hypothetical protein
MAAIMLLMSGWIGLAYAVVGHIITGFTMGQFFATWSTVGIVVFLAFGLIAAVRRFTASNAPLAA